MAASGSRQTSVYLKPDLAAEVEEAGRPIPDLIHLGCVAARSSQSPEYFAGYQQALADIQADITILAAGRPGLSMQAAQPEFVMTGTPWYRDFDGMSEADALAFAELTRLRYLASHGHRLDAEEARRLAELENAEAAQQERARGEVESDV